MAMAMAIAKSKATLPCQQKLMTIIKAQTQARLYTVVVFDNY